MSMHFIVGLVLIVAGLADIGVGFFLAVFRVQDPRQKMILLVAIMGGGVAMIVVGLLLLLRVIPLG